LLRTFWETGDPASSAMEPAGTRRSMGRHKAAASNMQRLAERVTISPNGCWEWIGHKSKGYGKATISGHRVRTHRVVYEHCVDLIPAGREVHHLCTSKSCLNPSHLVALELHLHLLVTDYTVVAIGSTHNAVKTHCPKGHAYSKENTRYSPIKGYMARFCRACEEERRATKWWRKDTKEPTLKL
jgi:hypothetical protein